MITPRPSLAPERQGSLATAMVGLALLIALLMVRLQMESLTPKRFHAEIEIGVLLLGMALGGVTIRAFTDRVFYRLRRTDLRAWRPVVTWGLYVILAMGLLSALEINLEGFLAAGAILGVIVGVAAQTSLASVFAGLVLLFARPFAPGSWVHMRTYLFAGVDYSGVVTQLGMVYTTMDVGGRLVRIPNSAVLASALTVTHMPIQLDIELQLTPQTSLHRLHQELLDRIHLGPGESVTLRPVRLNAEDEGQLVCQLTIRSHRAIDLVDVTSAIIATTPTPPLDATPPESP